MPMVGNKIKLFTNYKPHLHISHGKRRNPTQGSNQQLIAPLITPFYVSMSNTVLGRSFHIQTWAGRKYHANLDVLNFTPRNLNGSTEGSSNNTLNSSKNRGQL